MVEDLCEIKEDVKAVLKGVASMKAFEDFLKESRPQPLILSSTNPTYESNGYLSNAHFCKQWSQ